LIETVELYNGAVKLEFDSIKHQYRVLTHGRRFKVPSVTAICGVIAKPALVPWAVNATLDVCKGAIGPGVEYAECYLQAVWDAAKRSSRELKEDAAERGKTRHRILESFLRLGNNSGILVGGESPELEWLRSLGAESAVEVEKRIYSRRFRYSGTFDALITIQGRRYLVDWKTSKSIYPEYRLQTAAYCLALEEEFPDQKIAGRYLVRIEEEGNIEPHFFDRSTLRKDIQAFLGAKALFEQVQRIERDARKAKKVLDSVDKQGV